LIIFTLILQTIISAQLLFTGENGSAKTESKSSYEEERDAMGYPQRK